MRKSKSVVFCKLPKAGLGNQLFPLMKAKLFAHLNGIPMVVINYHQLKIGPWLRNDRSKRNYNRFFTFQKSIFGEILDKFHFKKIGLENLQIEPQVKRLYLDVKESFYFFNSMPHYTNYFSGLNENRELVIKLLDEIISPDIKIRLKELKTPVIGVHIRRGDFIIPEENEELGKRGTLRTPESYFINMIECIRSISGAELSVTIFSDASKNELKDLFKLPNVSMAEGNKDLEDLLLLSRSNIIVTSAGSTFSYWAGFLSNAPIIMHPTYVGIKIRPENVRNQLYEGAFDPENNCLINKIKSIK